MSIDASRSETVIYSDQFMQLMEAITTAQIWMDDKFSEIKDEVRQG